MTSQEFTVLLKRKPNWLIVTYTGIWLLGAMGILITLTFGLLTNPEKGVLFLLFVITLLILFSSLVLKLFLWNLRGKEKVTLTDSELVIEKLGTIFPNKKKYCCKQISEFSLNISGDNFFSIVRPTIWGLYGGQIFFKYGNKTIYFGQTLSKTDSLKLIDELNESLQATNR